LRQRGYFFFGRFFSSSRFLNRFNERVHLLRFFGIRGLVLLSFLCVYLPRFIFFLFFILDFFSL
jgi:hypothetical protein